MKSLLKGGLGNNIASEVRFLIFFARGATGKFFLKVAKSVNTQSHSLSVESGFQRLH